MQALEAVKAGLQPEEYPLKAEDHEAPDTVVPLFLTYRITKSKKPIYLKLNPDVSAIHLYFVNRFSRVWRCCLSCESCCCWWLNASIAKSRRTRMRMLEVTIVRLIKNHGLRIARLNMNLMIKVKSAVILTMVRMRMVMVNVPP